MTLNANQVRSPISLIAVTFLAAAGMALAQDQTPPSQPQQPAPPSGGWRKAGDAPPAPVQPPADPAAQPQSQSQGPSQPVDRTDAYGQPLPGAPQDAPPVPQDPPATQPMPQQPMPQAAAPGTMPQNAPNRPAYGVPSDVTLKQGTFVTVRTNQPLSSNHNLVGDTFTATLMQPVVANGIVVAQRGQLVYGRVSEAQKAHSDKPSRLGLQLTGLTLADGTQIPLQSMLVTRQGGQTPGGIQAGTVAGTTAVGAGVGAAVGWGTGAAIGAGAGAIVGLAGVLLTRNHPTVLYPETALTFQVSAPVTIATGRTPQAFHYVGPNDYSGPGARMTQLAPRPPMGPGYPGSPYASYYGGYGPYAYPAYGYPYPYYYPYYPYFGGFGIGIGVGGRFGGFGRWR